MSAAPWPWSLLRQEEQHFFDPGQAAFSARALLDGYHGDTSTFLVGHTPPFSALSPGVESLPCVLVPCDVRSLQVWRRELQKPTASRIRGSVVYALIGAWTLVSFLSFAL